MATDIHGSAQDCSNSIADALELLQSCVKPYVFFRWKDASYKNEWMNYCKVSNISCTKSQNLNDSRLVLQLSLPYPLKSGVESGMKM